MGRGENGRASVRGIRMLLLGMAIAFPATAAGQSTITGLVTDQSDAVLPGTTVEASSPSLIEGSRTGVADAEGRYRIIDLRPGTYRVTFVLPGFSTVVREGIELPSNFTATINAQLRVGAVEETVTVSGGAPVLDLEQVTRTSVLTRSVIDALPSPRTVALQAALLPGLRLTTPDVGGTRV